MAQCAIWENGKQCTGTADFWITCRRHCPPFTIFPSGPQSGSSYKPRVIPGGEDGEDGSDGGGGPRVPPKDPPPSDGSGGGAIPEKAVSWESVVSTANNLSSLVARFWPHIEPHIHHFLRSEDLNVLSADLSRLETMAADFRAGPNRAVDQESLDSLNTALSSIAEKIKTAEWNTYLESCKGSIVGEIAPFDEEGIVAKKAITAKAAQAGA